MAYRIIHWERYQGWTTERKSRRQDAPLYPWLKLHRKTIDSIEVHQIPEVARWQWFGLLCLADDTGVIHGDATWIAWRLRIDTFDPALFLGHFIEEIRTCSAPAPQPLRSRSADAPPRGEEKRGDIDQAKAGPGTKIIIENPLPAGGIELFCAPLIALEPERAEWWHEVYRRCEGAGISALEIAWSAWESIQHKDCRLQDKPRWVRAQVRNALKQHNPPIVLPYWNRTP